MPCLAKYADIKDSKVKLEKQSLEIKNMFFSGDKLIFNYVKCFLFINFKRQLVSVDYLY